MEEENKKAYIEAVEDFNEVEEVKDDWEKKYNDYWKEPIKRKRSNIVSRYEKTLNSERLSKEELDTILCEND